MATAIRLTGVMMAALIGSVAFAATFTHGWNVPISKQMWVDFYFIRGISSGLGSAPNLTQAQTEFVANNYAIISLEKCLGEPANNTIAMYDAWFDKFKAVNPDVKIIFYWSSNEQMRQCYAPQDRVWDAHPEWLPTQDSGEPVSTKAFFNNDSTPAADYWISVAAGIPRADGYFADGVGHPLWGGVSRERLDAASNATAAKLDRLRAAVPGRAVLGNTLAAYPQIPDFNMDFLPHLDGACAEHVAAFEQVLPGTNSLNTTMTAGLLTRMWKTAADMNKTVLARTWPGPVVTPISNLGPTWNVNAPATPQARAAAAADWAEWALSLYLTVATEYTFWSYNWWYNADSGVYPCPAGQCEAPEDWYPVTRRSPGAPLGPALRWTAQGGLVGALGSVEDEAETRAAPLEGRLAAGVYTRAFQHASVTLDLGTMTANITWV